MPISTGDLAQQLGNSGIIDASQLQQLRDASGLSDDQGTGEHLAKLLVKQGKLTRFQAQLAVCPGTALPRRRW